MVHAEPCAYQPIVHQKGDIEIAALYSSTIRLLDQNNQGAKGLDLQAAYVFADHWAVMGSQTFRWEMDEFSKIKNKKNPFDTSYTNYNRNFTTLGAGYINDLDLRGNIQFTIFGGVMFGDNSMQEKGKLDSIQNYNRFFNHSTFGYFLQPGFSFKMFDGNLIYSMSMRLGSLQFNNVSTDFTPDEQKNIDLFGLQGKNNFMCSFNGQLDVRLYSGVHVRLSCGIGMFNNSKDVQTQQNFAWRNLSGGIGLVILPSEF